MTTKDAQGIAATAGGGGSEVKLPERPEGLMKPKDMSDFEMPRQDVEKNQPVDKTTSEGNAAVDLGGNAGGGGAEVKLPERPEGVMKPKDMSDFEMPRHDVDKTTSEGNAAVDLGGNARFAYESGANVIEGPDSEARIPEGVMQPVPDGRRDELPFAAASGDADTVHVVDPGDFKPDDSGKIHHPEPVTRWAGAPLTSPIADASTVADVSSNVSGGQPLNAMGFNLDESSMKIPEGVMKPRVAGANPQPDVAKNIAAGHPSDQNPPTNIRIPLDVYTPAGHYGDAASLPDPSANIVLGQVVDASSADGHGKLPVGVMKPSLS